MGDIVQSTEVTLGYLQGKVEAVESTLKNLEHGYLKELRDDVKQLLVKGADREGEHRAESKKAFGISAIVSAAISLIGHFLK